MTKAWELENGRPLLLKRLRVKSWRCFDKVDIDFMHGKKPRMQFITVGRNGHGKTSVLRAIAIGLCQQRDASALLSELAGDAVRRNKKGNYAQRAEIVLDLFDPDNPSAELSTTTTIERDASGQELLDKVTVPEVFPWHRIFVCGYGVNRGVRHREARTGYSVVEALRSLFSDDTSLLDPEATLRNLKLAQYENGSDLLEDAKRQLRSMFRLGSAYAIDVSASEVLVHGPWGAMPFHALGDGYRGTAGWVLDLLGMALSTDRLHIVKDLRGIVLIDEIDEHLHPEWQRALMGLIAKRLPKLQIVATTHSPMTIVDVDSESLIACRLKIAVATVHQNLDRLEGKTADEILRGEWFGLQSTLDTGTERLLKKYQKAVEGGLNEESVAQLREQLRKRLGRRFDSPLDELALEIAGEVRAQVLGAKTPAQRRALVSKAADDLKKKVAKRGYQRGKK